LRRGDAVACAAKKSPSVEQIIGTDQRDVQRRQERHRARTTGSGKQRHRAGFGDAGVAAGDADLAAA